MILNTHVRGGVPECVINWKICNVAVSVSCISRKSGALY